MFCYILASIEENIVIIRNILLKVIIAVTNTLKITL